jgi:hypothetical protein
MYDDRTLLERSNGPFPRARVTAQRLKLRARRCPEKPVAPSRERALALKRYLCLLIEDRKIAQLQLTLRADLSDGARASVVALFRGARVMAFAVDKTTLLVAAGLPMTRALAGFAQAYGVLGQKLKARLKKDFGTRTPVLSEDELQRMVILDRALAAITCVDLPRPRAFEDAGFDLATIYSSQRSR